MILFEDEMYAPADALHEGQCENCKRGLQFVARPAKNELVWAAGCECGWTTYLKLDFLASVDVIKE